MKITIRSAMAAVVAATATLFAGPAAAQAYPTKPISIVVGYPAGGDVDVLARLFAEKLAVRLHRPVVVENRSGVSGMIASAYVARAKSDGYTLLLAPNTFAITPLVQKSSGVSYDVVKDFTPIIQLATQQLFIVVNQKSGVMNVPEMVAGAKEGRLSTYASPGNGSPMQILGELFNEEAGINLAQVPYRGMAPAVVDLVAGHVPVIYTTLGNVAQYVASGKLLAIAVADEKRSTFMPRVPTLPELGYPNVKVGAWHAVMGPKGMSPELVRTLNEHFNAILKMPDVIARMAALAAQPEGGDPARLGTLISSDYAMYDKLVRKFHIQAD